MVNDDRPTLEKDLDRVEPLQIDREEPTDGQRDRRRERSILKRLYHGRMQDGGPELRHRSGRDNVNKLVIDHINVTNDGLTDLKEMKN